MAEKNRGECVEETVGELFVNDVINDEAEEEINEGSAGSFVDDEIEGE
ncbi:MAG TPA: hypothetical protein IGS37_10020 [Synechococcales cyanobacterium M55_K2018_004]|nr:hypothetical protein [Synechococcales cyanobacterium M55_K2018_004]